MAAGAGVFLGSFLVYVWTLAPTVIWGDSAIFALQARALQLPVAADSHPLFVLLGHLFTYLPFDLPYSMNLLSATTASLAVLMVYLILRELTGSAIPSIIGAAALAFSHAFWLFAVTGHVRDLNAFFILSVLFVLLKWRKNPDRLSLLCVAVFLFGLGLTNHLVMALAGVGYLGFVVMTDKRIFLRGKALGAMVLSFLAGCSLLIFLAVKKMTGGRPAAVLADEATGRHLKKAMLVLSPTIIRDIALYVAYLFYQFPLAGFALLGFGAWNLFRDHRRTAVSLFLLIGVNMIFFLTFGPGVVRTTKYTFYISDYALFSLFIGYGAHSAVNLLKNKGIETGRAALAGLALVILLPVALYNVTPYVTKKLSIDLLHARSLPYRDNDEYYLNPGKRGYRGAERYAMEVLGAATKDSIIIADHTPFAVLLYYQQVHGMRKDVSLHMSGKGEMKSIMKVIAANFGKRDIFLAGIENGYYPTARLSIDYDFRKHGLIYKLVKV